MKRAIIAIILFLLLGLLTSIAVAWAVTLCKCGSEQTFAAINNEWDAQVSQRCGRLMIRAWINAERRSDHRRLDWSISDWPVPMPRWSRLNEPPESVNSRLRESAAGWPLLCVRLVRDTREPVWIDLLQYDLHGGIAGANPLRKWPGDWPEVYFLPIGPIWPNLLIDMMIFGAAWRPS